METKHTKGEWTITNSWECESTIQTTNGIRIAKIKSFGQNDGFNDPTFEEKEANAKLIATAPELLSALNDLIFTASILWEKCSPIKSAGAITVTHPSIENAKEVIKKATE